MKRMSGGVISLFSALVLMFPATAQDPSEAITVFVAKKGVTMEPSRPAASVVAGRDGKILSEGSLQDLAPWPKNRRHTAGDMNHVQGSVLVSQPHSLTAFHAGTNAAS